MMIRRLFLLAALGLGLGACANISLDDRNDDAIGDFRLGHAIVVAPSPVKSAVSREATPEEWIAAVDSALEARLRERFHGDRFYHVAVSVLGYSLAPPGIPIVAAPKSILIVGVDLWDDSTGTKLTEEPFQLVVGEGTDGDTFVSSGLTRTREEQMAILADRAAAGVEDWLRRAGGREGWFDRPPPPPGQTADDLEAAATKAENGAPADGTVTPRARSDSASDS